MQISKRIVIDGNFIALAMYNVFNAFISFSPRGGNFASRSANEICNDEILRNILLRISAPRSNAGIYEGILLRSFIPYARARPVCSFRRIVDNESSLTRSRAVLIIIKDKVRAASKSEQRSDKYRPRSPGENNV